MTPVTPFSSTTKELCRLLDSGFEISFTRDPSGYVACVDGPGYSHDVIADTPERALSVAVPCPAWCWGGEPGHPHAGEIALDGNTTLVLTLTPEGAITADLIGEPSETVETGSVVLPAGALTRLAQLAASL